MSLTSRLDDFQRRHEWAGYPLAVIYKYADDQGPFLAASITYYAFVSLFPLLLLLVTLLGYALHGNPELQRHLLNSALRQFPVIGDQLGSSISSLKGKVLAVVVGIGGSVYGGLGVAQAAQNAMNRVWAVPRNARPNPIRARLISLLVLLLIGGGLLVTTILSALTTGAGAYGADVGTLTRVLSAIAAVVINAGLFMVAFRLLTAGRETFRLVSRGALCAALSWQVLQELGTLYVGHVVRGSTATYGVFSVVLGLIAWLYLAAVTFVLSAEVNAVRASKLWPRSLLAPFTDSPPLTAADRRAYGSYPKTEKHKSFEEVDVTFTEPGSSESD